MQVIFLAKKTKSNFINIFLKDVSFKDNMIFLNKDWNKLDLKRKINIAKKINNILRKNNVSNLIIEKKLKFDDLIDLLNSNNIQIISREKNFKVCFR